MMDRNLDKGHSEAAPGSGAVGHPSLGRQADVPVLKSFPSSRGAGKATLLSVLLFGLVVWAFLPSTSNNFVNFDDNVYVCGNAYVRAGLTRDSVGWAFMTLKFGFWHPLTWLSLMLDYQLFGLRAGGYHLTSLLLHATNTVLLFLLFRQMTGATWRSALVAALFALHPLHVEPVAWAAGRKDVLSTFFWMLSLLMYVRYAQKRSPVGDRGSRAGLRDPGLDIRHSASDYLLALFFFVCGLMSKTMVVNLPFILLLMDWWPLQRLEMKIENLRLKTVLPLFWEKVPFFAASFFAGLITMYAQKKLWAMPVVMHYPSPDRIANAILSYVGYLVQTVWPRDLAVFYPYPKSFSVWAVVAAALLFLTVSTLAVRARRTRPYLVFGWLWYVVTLLPVIGLVQIADHAHADRYAYVPLIGVFVLLVWGACDLTRCWAEPAAALCTVAGVVLLSCLALTRQQIGYWQDSESLFRHALIVTKNSYVAHDNLGASLAARGLLDEAISHYHEALDIKPGDALAHNNLGVALGRKGELEEALSHIQKATTLTPDYPPARYNLGALLAKMGRVDEAIAQFQEALRLVPSDAQAHSDLGLALARQGRFEDAAFHFHEALRINPGYAKAHANLGNTLLKTGRTDGAMTELQRAIQIDPKLPDVHSDLGNLLLQKGRVNEAMEHYQRALDIQPANAYFLNNLAWVLATCPNREVRNGPRAVELAQQAERLGGAGNPAVLGTLAAAYAEAGRFSEALQTAQRALDLATAQTNSVQVDMLRVNIALFRAGFPFYDAAQTNVSPNLNHP